MPISKNRNKTRQQSNSKTRVDKKTAKPKKSGRRFLLNSKEKASRLHEPMAEYTSRLRPIGNSKGVILNNQVIEAAGLKQDADITIQAADGIIVISQANAAHDVNTDLSTWDKQFKKAIKKGAKPESDLFQGLRNDFDEKEW